jgi:glycerophosphoryl diester phosphodiesterase
VLAACSKIDYLPASPVAGWYPPVVLMHRGGGYDCAPGLSCMPNTLPAVLHGFDTLDGAEVDIEISADGTLWLGHDNETLDCAGNQIGCFQDLHDSAVDAVAYCNGASSCTAGSPGCVQHYVRLEEVFAAITGVQPSKMISLDIKGQYCRSLGIDDARHMAEEVDRLVRAYAMDWRVLAETSQLAFLDPVGGGASPIYPWVVSLGDVDAPLSSAVDRGATGISFKFAPGSEPMNASVVAGIHRVGQRVILWTINAADVDACAARRAAPDVIETDMPDWVEYVTSVCGISGP